MFNPHITSQPVMIENLGIFSASTLNFGRVAYCVGYCFVLFLPVRQRDDFYFSMYPL